LAIALRLRGARELLEKEARRRERGYFRVIVVYSRRAYRLVDDR